MTVQHRPGGRWTTQVIRQFGKETLWEMVDEIGKLCLSYLCSIYSAAQLTRGV